MLVSAKSEYACLAMLELAARYSDPGPIRLADVADKHGIPQRFLVQILLQLKGAGLVASTRGAAGGYQVPASQTPWQEIQRGIVDELSEGMVLKPAVKYQRIHATFGLPRDNH